MIPVLEELYPATSARVRREERREKLEQARKRLVERAGAAGRIVRRRLGAAADRTAAAWRWLFSPAVVAVVLVVVATGCTVAGVYLLSGLPWALLAAGGILFALGALLLRGIANG